MDYIGDTQKSIFVLNACYMLLIYYLLPAKTVIGCLECPPLWGCFFDYMNQIELLSKYRRFSHLMGDNDYVSSSLNSFASIRDMPPPKQCMRLKQCNWITNSVLQVKKTTLFSYANIWNCFYVRNYFIQIYGERERERKNIAG